MYLFVAQWVFVPVLLGGIGYFFISPLVGNAPAALAEVKEEAPVTINEVPSTQRNNMPSSEAKATEQKTPSLPEPEVEISVDSAEHSSSSSSSYSEKSSFFETFPKERKQKLKERRNKAKAVPKTELEHQENRVQEAINQETQETPFTPNPESSDKEQSTTTEV